MELIRIGSLEEGAAPLFERIVHELEEGKRVIWLVPGGSNIPLSVTVMDNLATDLTKNLTIYLTDERFGEVNHPDSNARQLREAGFDPKQARTVHVLAKGLTFEETIEQYALSFDTAAQ